jgi:ATP-dependent Lon protease
MLDKVNFITSYSQLESRRRVKEQQKKILESEFRDTNFSYVMVKDGVEKFVTTPESL